MYELHPESFAILERRVCPECGGSMHAPHCATCGGSGWIEVEVFVSPAGEEHIPGSNFSPVRWDLTNNADPEQSELHASAGVPAGRSAWLTGEHAS